MGEEAPLGAGARVIAEEDRGVERGVESLHHSQRFQVALDVLHARIEARVQQVLHVAVRVVHHDVGRAVLEDGSDDRVHLFGHQFTAQGVVLARPARHAARADPADSLHVDRDKDRQPTCLAACRCAAEPPPGQGGHDSQDDDSWRVRHASCSLARRVVHRSDHTASSYPPGSTKWNRRPPGNSKVSLTIRPPCAVIAVSHATRSVE